MRLNVNRREFLQGASAAALGLYVPSTRLLASTAAPTAPVAVARCTTYGPEVVTSLATDVRSVSAASKKLVSGKTVVIKVNTTGSSTCDTMACRRGRPTGCTLRWSSATVHLLGKAGARRIRAGRKPDLVAGSYAGAVSIRSRLEAFRLYQRRLRRGV